jgi:glutamyl-tRNA reductase
VERDILIVGLNHRTAPVALRERLGFALADVQPVLARLVEVPGVIEGALVSTCNRVEIVASVQPAAAEIDRALMAFLGRERDVHPEEFEHHLYVFRGRDAVRHLFRVASSLDSMVVGEPQILGQMKEHYGEAAAAGTSGAVLHRAFHRAFTVAKRVRSQTGIAAKAVSVASVAVDLTRTIFETLSDKTAMLVGAGKMSVLIARHLQTQGVAGIIITSRTFDRAVEVAREFGGVPVPFEQMADYLKVADVVIGSAGATGYLVSPGLVHDLLRARKQRPMFFIDMAVPRNFDPAINQLDNVYLYDIDDLARTTSDNAGERERERVRAEAIVEVEIEGYWRWLTSLDVVPTIVAIREKVEAIRTAELEKALASLQDQAPRHRALLDALTSSIVKKILHAPLSSLRREGTAPGQSDLVASARQLFALESTTGAHEEGGPSEDPEEEG